MKKLKIGFGEGGFKGFMARHVEKCVLVAVTALMIYFIYSGTSTQSLDKNLTRESLKAKAQQAELKITESRWEEVKPKRDPQTDVAIIVDQTVKVDPRLYAGTIWDPPLVPRLMPRMDPKLFAPEKLVVTPLFGPLMLMAPETDDELPTRGKYDLDALEVVLGGSGGMGGMGGMNYAGDDDDDKDTKGKKEPKAKREPKSKKGSEGSMNPMNPMGSAGVMSTKGGKKKKGDDPYDAAAGGLGKMSSMSGRGGAKQGRSIPPEATQGVRATQGALLQPRYAMVINAAVPYSKQWSEFQEAFKDAPGGQDPERDVPRYIAVWVDVLDVTEDPSVDPATAKGWKRLKEAELVKIQNEYGAEIQELVDPDALDEKLTYKVPPFLLTDLQSVLLHPDVPRATNEIETFDEESEIEAMETEEGEILTSPDGDEGQSPGGRGQMRPGGGMRGGMSPGRMPPGGGAVGARGSAGMGSAGMGSAARGSAARGSAASGSASRGGPSPRMGMGSAAKAGAGRMGAAMGGRGAGFGQGQGSGMNLETYRPVAKKLVRFVDYNVQPGRKYRYRMQLALNDPNHPEDEDTEPEESSLSETARERVRALKATEAKSGRRKYWISTPVSEPSEIMTMPSSEKFFAGEAISASTINIAGAAIPTSEPSAKVLTVKWDDAWGVFAPAEQLVHRGSMLNTRANVEVLHPVEGDLRQIKDYDLHTDGVVLDILGGEKLAGATDSKEVQRAPGETLILDAHGNLIVTDESRDVEGYRRYIFPEPKEDTNDSSAPSGTMSDSMSPPGYPDSKGGKGTKPGAPPRPGGMKSPGRPPK